RVLQDQTLLLTADGSDVPAGTLVEVLDPAGNPVPAGSLDDGRMAIASLSPGEYVLHVGDWSPGLRVVYQLRFSLLAVPENPPPLTTGPASLLRLRLVVDAPPGATAGPPQVVLPGLPVAGT